MLIPLLTLFLVASIVWLAIGIQGRKETALLAGSCGPDQGKLIQDLTVIGFGIRSYQEEGLL